MKVSQFNYRQHRGLATIFTAETEEEVVVLTNLRTLIEDEEGVLSRKSFSFDEGAMSVDIDRKQAIKKKRTANTNTITTKAPKRAKSDTK